MSKYTGVADDQGSQDPAAAITIGASPFSYVAQQKGFVNVQGGTISAIALTRGAVTTSLGTVDGNYPVSGGDTLKVTYSVAPTAMNFVPL